MGIFGALTTAITGLRAQSYALENISNNIANSQTTGYKRTDTTFADFVPDSPARQQESGVVGAFSRPTNTIQGDLQNQDVSTYMAINGDGYFIIGEQSGTVDGQPVFSGENLYTRRGDFELDRNGYLVNATGYFLKGLPIDGTTGNPSGTQPTVIGISNDFLPASATTQVTYRANLANYPRTSSADSDIANTELLSASLLDTSGDVIATNTPSFLEQTLAGGAITTYDEQGASLNVQMRWGKTDSVANGGQDTWNLFFLTDSKATGTSVEWKNIDQDYIFGADGRLSPDITNVTIPALTVDGISLGDITLNHGVNGITQFADANGVAKTTDISQDGYASGELVGVSISDEGRVVASYTNGRVQSIAEISIATFNADSFLAKTDGSAFRGTPESGAPILGGVGRVVGSTLESSNTDIADEFSKLIITQQAYAANTRIVSTGDEMIQEALNMIR